MVRYGQGIRFMAVEIAECDADEIHDSGCEISGMPPGIPPVRSYGRSPNRSGGIFEILLEFHPDRRIHARPVFQTQPRSKDGGRDIIPIGGMVGRLKSGYAGISRDIFTGLAMRADWMNHAIPAIRSSLQFALVRLVRFSSGGLPPVPSEPTGWFGSRQLASALIGSRWLGYCRRHGGGWAKLGIIFTGCASSSRCRTAQRRDFGQRVAKTLSKPCVGRSLRLTLWGGQGSFHAIADVKHPRRVAPHRLNHKCDE